jgi:hypothetical protein
MLVRTVLLNCHLNRHTVFQYLISLVDVSANCALEHEMTIDNSYDCDLYSW